MVLVRYGQCTGMADAVSSHGTRHTLKKIGKIHTSCNTEDTPVIYDPNNQ